MATKIATRTSSSSSPKPPNEDDVADGIFGPAYGDKHLAQRRIRNLGHIWGNLLFNPWSKLSAIRTFLPRVTYSLAPPYEAVKKKPETRKGFRLFCVQPGWGVLQPTPHDVALTKTSLEAGD